MMSRMCTSGRHGEPSLCSSTLPVVTACPTRLLTTMSARRRRDTPYAVALRRYTGENVSSASSLTSCSTRTFDSPYGVTGLNGGRLVEQVVAAGAVQAARRREQEPLDAGRPWRPSREAHRGVQVDVVGQLRR